jgi:DNA-binding transcriptional regulator GbsR (MarR family)
METEKIREQIFSTFASIAKDIGYSEVYGRIIACLLIHQEPVTLNDVAKETGYSAPMVSLSVDFLETVGMIKRVKKPGDRKLYLQSNGSLLDGLKKAILVKLENNVSTSLQEFEKYKEQLKNIKGDEEKKLLKAIETLKKEIKRMDNYMRVLSKIKML